MTYLQLSPLAWQREADRLRMMARRAERLGGDDAQRTAQTLHRQSHDAAEMARRGLAKGGC